jgi:hypothetical protein
MATKQLVMKRETDDLRDVTTGEDNGHTRHMKPDTVSMGRSRRDISVRAHFTERVEKSSVVSESKGERIWKAKTETSA